MLISDDVTVSSSGRIEIAVEELALSAPDNSVSVTYGGKPKKARVSDTAATQTIEGMFQAYLGARSRGAGTVEVTITNAQDGSGTATIDPGAGESVRAGSLENLIVATFEAAGTMDGGSVSFEPATDWGDLQQDPTKLNYIDVQVSGRGAELGVVDYGSRIVVANLMTLPPGGEVEFTYGGGTVDDSNGAQAQSDIGIADFIIKSAGSANGQLKELSGEELTDDDKETNEKALGRVYDSALGVLKVAVAGASDGTGYGDVTVVKSAQSPDGKAIKYVDYADMDEDGDEAEEVDDIRIHAADDNTYLKFVYTPTQTIEDGELKFIVDIDAEWSSPQGTSTGIAGYTRVDKTGADTDLGLATFDTTAGFVTVPIDHIDTAGTIEIHYGAYTTAADGGGASVPKVATLRSPFTIEVKGGDSDDNALGAIRGNADGERLAVRIWSQASGGGSGDVTAGGGDLSAGDMEAVLTIVYTAAGEIENGMLKLSVPSDKWSAPTIDNLAVSSNGSIDDPNAMDYGGYYTAKEMDLPDDGPGALEVHVGGVSLDADDTVTFVYTTMVQPAIGDVEFTISVDGGAGPGTAATAIEDPMGNLTVSVGEARNGSGTGAIDLVGKEIKAGDTGVELVFTYTAAGEIESRDREIRVSVPEVWSEPNGADAGDDEEGTYTVTQMTLDDDGDYKKLSGNQVTVEKIGPFGQDMAARVKRHKTISGGDRIIFTYQNADAPRTVAVSTFEVSFGGVGVDNVEVIVQSDQGASMLVVNAPDRLSADDDDPVAVTVMLADSDEEAAAMGTDLVVDLGTSNADTGSFSDKAGETVTTVTIKAGTSSAMVYYSDTTVGEATITASTDDLTGTDTVVVSTDMVEITSVTVTSPLAMAGDTVTVSARGTAGKVVMYSVLNANDMGVQPSTMTEDEAGSYSGMFDVVVDHHPDGDYTVTVNLNGESMTTSLTIDSTAPAVTVSDIEGMVANGDTVMISAMVDDGDGSGVDSVMADVSMLDSTQGMVTLSMGTDGSYSAAITISEDNAAMNGEQTITVTAMDAAGNSGMGSTTAELMNTLSFTSMIPAGISLFHVPLDVEGLDTVGDLEAKLGDNVNILITYDGTLWNGQSDDVMITATLGILVSLSAETSVTFEGHAWDDGSSMISLQAGSNLIGLPVDVEGVDMISHIMGLFDEGVVSSIIVSSGGGFQLVAAAGDAADGPVAGDAAYLVIASAAASAAVMGDGWMNGEMAGAAPIALAGYTVDNQTPVLDVLGSVVDEITGLAKEGFRVKAKNLSTKAVLSNVTSVEATDGYNMTFVDLADSYAARVGDVLEISADSPDPLLGIKPVRHIVTVDDVKNSRIQLEDLIAYEIPAETELLRNYPNPFNPETWIPYRLAEDADVSLTIYDTSGALVRSIDIGHQTAAVYETRAKAIYWDGRNQFGEQVASGLYFYHLNAGDDFSGTRRMVILK